MTAFVGLLGHHDWVVRLPAVLLSGLTVPLLYGLGRALWGPVSGAVAVVAFVTLPIALAFCNLSNLEVPAIFGMLLLAWSCVRFLQSALRRFWWLSLFAAVFACGMDWPGLVFSALWLGGLFLTQIGFATYFRVSNAPAVRRLLLVGGLLVALTVTIQISWFARLGQLGDFLRSGSARTAGAELPLAEVLESRRYWIELSFTWLAVLIGKLMLPVLLVRVVALRRPLEWCVLALLGAASFHYVVFKNGADVHVFWSHYFAPYYALALGALVATLQPFFEWLGQRAGAHWLATRGSCWPQVAALCVGLLPSLFIMGDGVSALVYARLTGGRFDQRGALIHADKDKVAFMEWLAPSVPVFSGAVLHPSMKPSFWMSWSLGRPLFAGPAPFVPSSGRDRFYLLDARFAEGAELKRLAATFQADVVGPYWAFDRALPVGPPHGFAIRRRAPLGWERYFISGVHDLYAVEPSALHAWEAQDHFAQPAGLPKTSSPKDAEELRILHNLALSRGDAGAAAERLAELLRGADLGVATDYDDGTQLLAILREPRQFRILFRAARPPAHQQQFRVFSRVSRPKRWSLVPRDTQPREVGLQSSIPRPLWKKGYVYSLAFELLPRPGFEELYGAFSGPYAPKAQNRAEPLVLARGVGGG